jgi:hypothetical protein
VGFEVIHSGVNEDIRLLEFDAVKSGWHGLADMFSLSYSLQGRRPRPSDMSLAYQSTKVFFSLSLP